MIISKFQTIIMVESNVIVLTSSILSNDLAVLSFIHETLCQIVYRFCSTLLFCSFIALRAPTLKNSLLEYFSAVTL